MLVYACAQIVPVAHPITCKEFKYVQIIIQNRCDHFCHYCSCRMAIISFLHCFYAFIIWYVCV